VQAKDYQGNIVFLSCQLQREWTKKVATLTRQYESYTKKEGESVDDMFGRIQVLLNWCELILGLHILWVNLLFMSFEINNYGKKPKEDSHWTQT